MSPRKAIRSRKARHSGPCPVCRRLVLVGELIASVHGGPFMCISHVTKQDTDPKEDIMSRQPALFDHPGQREFHPLTRILPPPEASEDVVASITAALTAGRNYLDMHPITLDQAGRIVDGRLRYLACLRSGTEPVYETLGAHYTDVMILEFIRSKNVLRQHLGPDQLAVIMADYERMIEQAEAAP